jgi:hypothetical protein
MTGGRAARDMRPHYRAVFNPPTPQTVAHWQIQQRGGRWLGSEYWRGVCVVAEREAAQSLVNQLEFDGIVYPSAPEGAGP